MTEPNLRVLIFLVLLIVFSLLEFFFSYRKRILSRRVRWTANIMLVLCSSLLLKLVAPMGLGYFGLWTEAQGLGFFNLISFDFEFEIFFSLVLFDGLIYLQHVLSHKWHYLWKLHRVHHADVDLDATSALRFHPLEIGLSFFYKVLCIFIFGFSAEAIFLLEIILSSMALFNHSNIYLPKSLESFLRLLIVTPQMHIIHHSTEQYESDSNYGFNLSIWDRIFKTYTAKFTSKGVVGQKSSRSESDHKLQSLLKMPFL
jgi:sterol desaturase/sphingolipid hydroxylase (fatty acid hydroxylase superfamily)